ncbi:hypothetical protein AJ78_07253 [Emergomyces pasteurianus Ep9510]|uniref:Uncharacterized protein n=1 Tax=Emergomyces pasteurianus Ep9510 TaxID=1447872 RepID=A0A1J9P6N9_9EURO|nr:hypothetical protein AJ78_07253 [Emergomyces pasteurianus Ep9510]
MATFPDNRHRYFNRFAMSEKRKLPACGRESTSKRRKKIGEALTPDEYRARDSVRLAQFQVTGKKYPDATTNAINRVQRLWDRLYLKWKLNMLNIPVFRQAVHTVERIRISPDKALLYDTFNQFLEELPTRLILLQPSAIGRFSLTHDPHALKELSNEQKDAIEQNSAHQADTELHRQYTELEDTIRAEKQALHREAFDGMRQEFFATIDTTEIKRQLLGLSVSEELKMDDEDNVQFVFKERALREGSRKRKVSSTDFRTDFAPDGIIDADTFPITCPGTQCLFCLGDSQLPHSAPMYSFSRPGHVRRHVQACHLRYLDPDALLWSPHPSCPDVVDGVKDFQGHALLVHNSMSQTSHQVVNPSYVLSLLIHQYTVARGVRHIVLFSRKGLDVAKVKGPHKHDDNKSLLFGGPLFSRLRNGLIANGHPRVLGHCLFRHRPDHWTFMIRDHSPLDSKGKNGKNYLLRSEIMGITSILYRQMNEVRWDPRKHEYMQPKLTYRDGPLTATIVTFMVGKVRVVQATCDPSNPYPTLTCTLRGLYNLSMSCYDKSSVHKIVKWILCPPELAGGVPLAPVPRLHAKPK